MRCRLTARQCISATVARNNAALGVKLDASFVSFVFHLPLCRACCHTRLSAYAVIDRREPLPAFANLLGLYGRGDRAAWAMGGGRDGHCPASPLPPLGHRRVRSGAQDLAKARALVAPVDLCRACGGRKPKRIILRSICLIARPYPRSPQLFGIML